MTKSKPILNKKTSTKKVPSENKSKKKLVSKKEIRRANETEAFWVTNGMILYDLLDLANALTEMEDDHYWYHATGNKNDFSVWVEQILCDEECASALQNSKNKQKALATVKKHLKVYSL